MTADDYRALAKDALKNAEAAPNADLREHWRKMARGWEELAKQAEAPPKPKPGR